MIQNTRHPPSSFPVLVTCRKQVFSTSWPRYGSAQNAGKTAPNRSPGTVLVTRFPGPWRAIMTQRSQRARNTRVWKRKKEKGVEFHKRLEVFEFLMQTAGLLAWMEVYSPAALCYLPSQTDIAWNIIHQLEAQLTTGRRWVCLNVHRFPSIINRSFISPMKCTKKKHAQIDMNRHPLIKKKSEIWK